MVSAIVLGFLTAQPQTVTFTHACARAEVVLADLGKELGVSMKPSGSVMQDYFLVRFDGVPVAEALEKIATTLNATWSEKGGVQYLGRTHAQELADAKEEKDAQAKLIQDWLDKRAIKDEYTLAYAKGLIEKVLPILADSASRGSINIQEQQAMDQQSPAGRCLTRLVKEIGVETFADLGPDDQVTYAPQPNAFQRKLPNGEAMRVYERENAVHKAAIAETGAAERVEQGGFFSELIHPYTTSFYQYKETSLSVRRQDLSIVVELRLTDGGYSRVFINATQLNAGSVPDALAKQPGQYDASSLEQELGKAAMAMFSGQGDKPQVSVETQALMMDPVANEPLSLLGSRWLLASANALGRNVVALMSDEMYLLSLVALSQGQQKYASMWTMVPQIGKPYEIAIDDRWLTMRPADRAEVRSQRIDRAKWKALIGSLPPGRSAGLDEYAGYAALSDNELMVFVAMLPAMFADQAISIDTLGRRDLLDTMRVYAGLTVTQRKAARTDYVEVPIARLDARTARAARRIVFAEDSLLAQGREQPDWRSPGLVRYPGWEKDKASRLLGAGVPRGSVLRVRVLETDLLYSRPTTGARPGSGMTPEDLGRSKAMNEFYPQSLSVDVGFVCSAKAQQLLLEFEFPGIGYLYRRGQVDLLPREMVYAPVTDLSKEVQARIEAAYKSAAAEYRKAKGGGGE